MTPKKSNEQVAEIDIKFPLIMKTLRGSKGVGVLFIDSEKGLDSIVQLIHKQDEDADLLIQEYIKTEYDVRVHVLGGKVLATARPVIEGDFRSNVSQGSKPKKITLTELEIEECLKAKLRQLVVIGLLLTLYQVKTEIKNHLIFLK